MKKLLAIFLLIISIVSLSSCKSNSNGNSFEDKYYAAAEKYVKDKDYETALKVIDEGLDRVPDSKKLSELKNEISDIQQNADNTTLPTGKDSEITTTTTTTTAKPTQDPTKAAQPGTDSVILNFIKYRTAYEKWFRSYNFNYDYNSPIQVGEATKFPVKDSEIKTKSDLDKLFLQYCDKETYKSICNNSFVSYEDINGVIHCVFPYATGFEETYSNENATCEKVSKTEFLVKFDEVTYVMGEYNSSRKKAIPYTLGKDGKWRFGPEMSIG